MPELFYLIIVVLVVALVGHGIWVLARAGIRGLIWLLGGETRRPIQLEICRRCGEVRDTSLQLESCPVCGWSTHGPVRDCQPNLARAVESLRRRVERWAKLGVLTPEQRDQVLQALPALQPPAPEPLVQESPPLVRSPPVVKASRSHEEGTSFPEVEEPRSERVVEPVSPAADIRERARRFEEFRQAAAVETPETPLAPVNRSQPFLRILAGFLEEKNIRWGELVGGLLIVGCSLALVISFWSSIAERPLLKFGLFTGVTALLYLIGIRAEQRWSLPTTARGLFVIATLLVPLNFLSVASMSRGATSDSLWGIAGELSAIVIFGWFTLRAGRSLVANSPEALSVSVLAPSIAMLMFRRWIGSGTGTGLLLGLGTIPLLAQGGVVARVAFLTKGEVEISEARALQLLRLIGVSSFAVTVALGLLIIQAGFTGTTIRRIAPLAPLEGASVLAVGMLLWRRTTQADLVLYRTAGTSISAAGILLMLSGVVVAWPEASGMLPVALLCFGVLTAIAVIFAVPSAHVLAGLCLALAYLLAWQVGAGQIEWSGTSASQMVDVLFSTRSGAALVPLVLLGVVAADVVLRKGRRLDAQAFALVSALAGLFSIGLATWLGFGRAGDPSGATWIYATYALTAIVAAHRFERNRLLEVETRPSETLILTWLGSALALLATTQGVVYGLPIVLGLPWVVALLGHSTIVIAAATLVSALKLDERDTITRILMRSCLGTSCVAAMVLIVAAPSDWAATLASRWLWLAVVWLALAWRSVAPVLFAAFQAALAVAMLFAVAAFFDREGWYRLAPRRWLDPWSIQAQAIALGGLCLSWIGARIGLRWWNTRQASEAGVALAASALLNPPWPAFDRFLRGAVSIALVTLAAYGVMPGVAQELTPRDLAAGMSGVTRVAAERIVPPAVLFEIAGVPHTHALGVGSWALLLVVLTILIAGQWERFRRIDLLGALVVLSMAAPLAAGVWEPDVAAASALRWTSAIALLGVSSLIWNRKRLATWAVRLGWRIEPGGAARLEQHAAEWVIGLALLPVVAIAGYVGAAALVARPPDPGSQWLWFGTSLLFALLAVMTLSVHVVTARFPESEAASWRNWLRLVSSLLVLVGMLLLVVVTVFVVSSALEGNPVVGPTPGSMFARLGNAGSYVPPILLLAATLVGYAVRERSASFAFSAGLVLNIAATAGYLLVAVTGGLTLDATLWVCLARLNTIVLSAYSLSWMIAVLLEQRQRGDTGPLRAEGLLGTLVALAVALYLMVLMAGIVVLLFDPTPHAAHLAIASATGWVAVLLGLAAVAGWARWQGHRIPAEWLGLGTLAMAVLAALSVASQDTGQWLTYHTMIMSLTLCGASLPLFAWHHAGMRLEAVPENLHAAVTRWATVAMILASMFAIRGYRSDPISSWWTVGPLIAMTLLSAALAAWSRWAGYVTFAGILVNILVSCWWLDSAWSRISKGWAPLGDFIFLNIVALALPVAAWLWLDRRVIARAGARDVPEWSWPLRMAALPFPRFASWTALTMLFLVVAYVLADGTGRSGDQPIAILGWMAVSSVGIAMAAGLWDGRERGAVAGVYLLGLCACGYLVAQFNLPLDSLAWVGTMVLAAYSVAASSLWSFRRRLRLGADRLGIPRPEVEISASELNWLVPANLILAASVQCLAFWSIVTNPDAILRGSAAHAALAEVLAIGVLAHEEHRSRLRRVALAVGVLGAVAWGWAWIMPGSPFCLMDRMVVVLVALITATALYGLVLTKLWPRVTEWTAAASRLCPALLVLAGVTLAVIFGSELLERAGDRSIPMSWPSIVAVTLALLGAAATALMAALVPGRDPLGLSERGRTVYVYACEAILAVFVLHLGMTLPWMFSGFFVRYWPLILLGVAFLGTGLSEVFRREGRMVLAEPLERTGALMPLLPLLSAFWMAPRPGEDVVFLVLTGAVYATLSLLRSSAGFAALAALAFNGALWTALSRWNGFSFAEHPQLWVIPPALCVLVGAYLNRDRLSEAQTATIRYVTALAIYISSTTDILLTGVAQAPWLPFALAALSIGGIFTGILLRVRGFLFLGLGFLTLALFTIIWHAAVDLGQTWLWPASGIVAGILILALFALFEKKRQEVLHMVEQLKEWKA